MISPDKGCLVLSGRVQDNPGEALVPFHLFLPAVYHRYEMGPESMTQRGQVEMDNDKGSKEGGHQEVYPDNYFYSAQCRQPAWCNKEEQQAGYKNNWDEGRHDHQVCYFLHRVKLVIRRTVVRIWETSEVIKAIEHCLSHDAGLQVIRSGDIELPHVSRNK